MKFTECLAEYRSRVHPNVVVTLIGVKNKIHRCLHGYSDDKIVVISRTENKNERSIPVHSIAELELLFHTTENPGGGEADGSGNELCLMQVSYHHKLTRDDSPGGWCVEDLTQR